MEMSPSEWGVAFFQVAMVIAVSFVLLLVATSFIRFQMLAETIRESEELGEGEDRLFRVTVMNEIAIARKQRRPISVMLLDVGATGPTARELENVLKGWVRASDHVHACGERLVGLLLDCGSERSDVVARRLVERGVGSSIAGAVDWRFGVAGYPEHGTKTSILYQRAVGMVEQAARDHVMMAGMAAPEEVAEDVSAPSELVDPVTGLVSEEKMIGVMRRYVARERRVEQPVSMIYFDIDQFTALAGQAPATISDALLKEVANYIEGLIRERDLIARFGKGGFIVAMPVLPDAAMLSAQRVVQAVRKRMFNTGSDVKVSISAGVAGYPDVLGSAVQYFVAAETALRNARLRGRNQCVKYDHTMQIQPEGEKHIDSL